MVKNNRFSNLYEITDNSKMFRLMQKTSAAYLLENYASMNIARHLTSVNTGNTRNFSKVQSITNPQGLPNLPVPKLEDTLQKFLKSVHPHLSAAEYAKTQDVVKKFAEKDGPKLQELLVKHAAAKENWLSDWWLTSAYLEYRDPVIVFSSPGLVFPQRKFQNEKDKIDFTAKLISAALSYKQLIDAKKIAMEHVGKNQLDMAQYDKIFGTCRIPGIKYDTLIYNPKSKHIAVIINNIFFKVPVYGGPKSDQILSEKEIVAQIEKCLKQASYTRDRYPIGILSSDNRDNWGIAYNELIKDSTNKKTLTEIQTSLFVVSIDSEMPQDRDGDDIVTACNQLIHGGGINANSGNRFYDKTVQFIVGSNGINGLTYEHSPAEGQPIAVLTDYVVNYIDSKRCDNATDLITYEDPIRLDFNINETIEEKINLASKNLNELAEDLEMNYIHFTDYGKDFIKTQKMSPDSYIQMAIQYAFYRLHKVPGAHYESAQTRMFVHGRTETIRSCSNESIAFAKAMTEQGSDADRVEKLKAAVQSHKNYVSMAIQGLGVDRHFLGLKLIAKNNNIELPEIYKDPGYVKSSHMRLSTSQVASRYDAFMCYGPLTSDGYGCCYSPKDKDMWFGLSSFKSCSETSTKLFKKSLEEALRHMYEVLVNAGEKPKSKL